mgnify:CR=1 FL=1
MRFRPRLLAVIVAAIAVFSAPVFTAIHSHSPIVMARTVASRTIPMFDTEAAAQRHCPSDQVVWLNTRSGIYHEKGMRWYGRTKQGAYVCRKEADAAGYRDTRNGQ